MRDHSGARVMDTARAWASSLLAVLLALSRYLAPNHARTIQLKDSSKREYVKLNTSRVASLEAFDTLSQVLEAAREQHSNKEDNSVVYFPYEDWGPDGRSGGHYDAYAYEYFGEDVVHDAALEYAYYSSWYDDYDGSSHGDYGIGGEQHQVSSPNIAAPALLQQQQQQKQQQKQQVPPLLPTAAAAPNGTSSSWRDGAQAEIRVLSEDNYNLYYYDGKVQGGFTVGDIPVGARKCTSGKELGCLAYTYLYGGEYVPLEDRVIFDPVARLFVPYLTYLSYGEIELAEADPLLAARAQARRIGLYLSYFAEGFFEYLPPTGFAEFGPSTANVWAAAARSRGTAGAAAKTRQQANRRITYSRNNLMANMRELVDASTAFAAFSAGLYINANPDAANPFLTQLPQRTVAGGQGTFGRPTQLG